MNYYISTKENLIRRNLIKCNMVIGDKKASMLIAPTLSQYGLNIRDFTGYLDSSSFYVKDGFEVHCKFYVKFGDILSFKLYEPSTMFFLKNMSLFKGKGSTMMLNVLKCVYHVANTKSFNENLSTFSLYKLCLMFMSTYKSFNKL